MMQLGCDGGRFFHAHCQEDLLIPLASVRRIGYLPRSCLSLPFRLWHN